MDNQRTDRDSGELNKAYRDLRWKYLGILSVGVVLSCFKGIVWPFLFWRSSASQYCRLTFTYSGTKTAPRKIKSHTLTYTFSWRAFSCPIEMVSMKSNHASIIVLAAAG